MANIGFLAPILGRKIKIPNTFVIAHWWRFQNHETLQVVFAEDNIHSVQWVRNDGDIEIDWITPVLPLEDGDHLLFSYNVDQPRSLKIESWCNSQNMVMPNFMKGRSFNTYLHQIPRQFVEYVVDIVDLESNGDCGYSCVAIALGNNVDSNAIRNDLVDEVLTNPTAYASAISMAIGVLVKDLKEKWMATDFCLIVSMKYHRPVIMLTSNHSELFVDQKFGPPDIPEDLPFIIICHVNGDHYVQVELTGNFPILAIIEKQFENNFNRSWRNYLSHFYPHRFETQFVIHGEVDVEGQEADFQAEREEREDPNNLEGEAEIQAEREENLHPNNLEREADFQAVREQNEHQNNERAPHKPKKKQSRRLIDWSQISLRRSGRVKPPTRTNNSELDTEKRKVGRKGVKKRNDPYVAYDLRKVGRKCEKKRNDPYVYMQNLAY